MLKVIILAAIVVSVSAQLGYNRGFEERRYPRGDSGELAGQEYEGKVRTNPTQRHMGHEGTNEGGFQNGNFAPHDGRLKTNLNSGQRSNQNHQTNFQREGPYVVEGAAFRRQENQYVESSQGNVQRIVGQNVETENRGRAEQTLNSNQRTPNINDQIQIDQGLRYNEQSAVNSANTNRNRFIKETQNKNYNGNSEAASDQNIRQQNQNTNQNSQEPNAPPDQNRNEGETNNQNTRQQGHLDLNARRTTNTNEHRPNSQNKPSQEDQNINSNKRNQNNHNLHHLDRNKEIVLPNNNRSKAIAAKVSTNLYLDKEAKELEINNQITKLIFEESTQPIKKGKTTEDNELHTEVVPTRRVSGKPDDRWIWSDGSEVKATTEETSTPGVDDRAAFVGSQCPTGKTKINGMCVDED